MSIRQSLPHSISEFAPILSIVRTRKYQLIMLVSAAVYVLIYTYVVGIISYYPGLALLKVNAPIISTNSLGIMIIPGNYIFIFVFYSAIAFLTLSSILVGLNVALMAYSRNLSKTCSHCQITNIRSNGILAILPAFFTSFSCCGGGLLAFIVGAAAFSSLAVYSSYVAPLTTAVLATGIWVMSRKITQLKKIIIADECYFAQGSRTV